MKFRKLNFEKEINTKLQKVIQVNESDVYFIAGMHDSGLKSLTKKCYRFNLRNRTVERIANTLVVRSGFGICNIGTKIYIMGGNQQGSLNSNQVYDIDENKWQAFVQLPITLISPTAVVFQNRFIYLIGEFTTARNQDAMSEILRIDTYKGQEEMKWETIQIKQDDQENWLQNICQFSIIDLGLLYPNETTQDEIQLLLFGGLHRLRSTSSELYHIKIIHNGDEEQQVLNVEITKIQDKNLTINDRFQYNQWLALENTRDCKDWFMFGIFGGHFIKFPQSINNLQDIEIESREDLGYMNL
eukprot:403358475